MPNNPIHYLLVGNTPKGPQDVEIHGRGDKLEDSLSLSLTSEGAFTMNGHLFLPIYSNESGDSYAMVYPLPADYSPDRHELWAVSAVHPQLDHEIPELAIEVREASKIPDSARTRFIAEDVEGFRKKAERLITAFFPNARRVEADDTETAQCVFFTLNNSDYEFLYSSESASAEGYRVIGPRGNQVHDDRCSWTDPHPVALFESLLDFLTWLKTQP